MKANADDELIRTFEDCSLPLDALRHSVHIQIAFLYLRRYSVLDVLSRFPEALKRFAQAHGKTGLYHETISWAYILLIHERMRRAGHAQTWEEFQSANPDLMNWSDSILRQYYRHETMWSEMARETFLFPDKAPALPRPLIPPAAHSKS